MVNPIHISKCFMRQRVGAYFIDYLPAKRVIAPVLVLFPHCCPPAISWPVTKVVVDTFYRQPIRLISHVRQKPGEIPPRLAHRYSSTAIVCVSFVCWSMAPANHVRPNPVHLSHFPRRRVAVLGTPGYSGVSDQAAAALCSLRFAVYLPGGNNWTFPTQARAPALLYTAGPCW